MSDDYIPSGRYNIDINVLSSLAFKMLSNKKTSFTKDDLECIISKLAEDCMVRLSTEDFLRQMQEVKIIYQDLSEGDVFRFKYPYIYYYFAGRYIAYNLNNEQVQDLVEYMSTKLYNETYGNIIIFVCHFPECTKVLDDIMYNAYSILSEYEAFDFSKSNPIFEKVKDAVEALIPKTIVNNAGVEDNKNKELMRMDDAGVNDGHVTKGEETIDDDISEKERDMAAVSAAFKTMEVLGQILQNYPLEVRKKQKIEIIDEIHRLGMRSVQAVIKTMGYIENDLVEFIFERMKIKNKLITKENVATATRKFVNMLVTSMAQGMVHQVALSLNSEFLLEAATHTFNNDETVSSKLVLLDLKLNCLKSVNYVEIKRLKESFDDANEKFASRIVDSIVGHYLNYNKCNYDLRAKLCQLCGFSDKDTLINNKKMLNMRT